MDTKTAKDILTEAGLNENPWGIRVIAAEKRGSFTEDDKDDANNWKTCAVGVQDSRIQRYEDGEPYDEDLTSSGSWFSRYVDCNKFVEAAEVLIDVERRAAEIIGRDFPTLKT